MDGNLKFVLKYIIGFIIFVFLLVWFILSSLSYVITDKGSYPISSKDSNSIGKDTVPVFHSTIGELLYVLNKHKNNVSYDVASINSEDNSFIKAKCNIINFKTIFTVIASKGISGLPDNTPNSEFILDYKSLNNLNISPFNKIIDKLNGSGEDIAVRVDFTIDKDMTSVFIKSASDINELNVIYDNKKLIISQIKKIFNNKVVNEVTFSDWVF